MNLMSDVKNAQDSCRVEPVWDQNRPARDESSGLGTSGALRGVSGADWLLFAVVAAVALGIGIVNALSAAQDAVWRGGVYDARTPLLWEMTSIVTIILLAPMLLIAVRRISDVSGWPLRVGFAVAAVGVFSLLHIAGMVGLRKLAMLLVGGTYNFHFSAAVLIYEFRKDVVTCVLIGGALWLVDRRREAQSNPIVSAANPAPAAPHMVWLRDGSTRIRIEPRDILWIGSAGNYVEYSLADGVNHLVRGTLSAEETRLRRFNIVRVHRTRLINLSRVTGLRVVSNGDFELTLDTGQVVSCSRRYRGAVAAIEAPAANSALPRQEDGARP
jgi:hypothetical protein